jgi:3-phenylpropionate/trans-cinnamate dioxygenase ferredoxin reductase component
VSVVAPLRPAGPRRPGAECFVIVGAGQAGAQAATTLRERGFRGRVVVIGDEPHLPYMRPPLSKKFLSAEQSQERLYLRPSSYFEAQGIELRTGVHVTGIDRSAGRLRLDGGASIAYDKLLLATGSRPRTLSVPGEELAGIHYLRTIDDASRLRSALKPGCRLVVVGAGYLGLEVAATAVAAGARVTVLEIDERILGRVTTAGLSDFMTDVHRSRGVDVRCGSRVVSFSGDDRLRAVRCAEGGVEADLAIVGIGAVPDEGLARDAGLACDSGILVDEHGRTSDPNIFAAGDCTRHSNAIYGCRVRLESVQNAIDQATVAAVCMGGGDLKYRRVPWFWSNQYEFKLQSAGLFDGFDEIIERGERATGRFALLYRKAGQLIAVDAVNMPAAYLAARRTIGLRGEVAIDAATIPQLRAGASNQPAEPRTAAQGWTPMAPRSVAG